MMRKEKIKVGFIPVVHCNKEAEAIATKAVNLFNDGLINRFFTTSGMCIPQLLKSKGIPVGIITFFPPGKEIDFVKILTKYLKKIPKAETASGELPLVRIITPGYCSMRFNAIFSRVELDALTYVIPANCRERSLEYFLKLLKESCRIFKRCVCT